MKTFAFQSPDVIYIGNIRDYETMATAMTAAETGVLVLSTLHTINAAQTVERIINFFPPYQHEQVAIQLSSLLKGVISLRLVPYKEKSGRIPAYESMVLTPYYFPAYPRAQGLGDSALSAGGRDIRDADL